MSIRTRTTALVLALALALGAAGCSKDTSYAAALGETKFATGIYNNYLLEGFVQSYNVLPDKNQSPNVQMIGDIPGYRWIENYAKDALKRYAATKSLFDKAGLTLSLDELASLSTSAQSQYDANPTLFEGCNVTVEDIEAVQSESLWVQKLFEYYYGVGGPEAPGIEELRELYEREYVRIVFVPVLKYDDTGALYTDAAKVSQLSTLAEGYFERAAAGTPIQELLVEETYRREQENAAAAPALPEGHTADDGHDHGPAATPALPEGHTADDGHDHSADVAQDEAPLSLEERIAELQVALMLDPNAYDQVFSREQSALEPALLNAIFTSTGAAPELYEGDQYWFLFQRKPLDADPEDFETYRSTLTQTLKYEDFLKKFDDEEAAIPLTYNDATIKKYAAKKLNIAFNPQ